LINFFLPHTNLLAAPFDYATVSQVLTFSSSVTFQTMSVSIIDDNLLEINETFNASLALENATDAAGVVLQPDSVNITILDEDGKHVVATDI
jgi:hypothetical protein